ncbi:zinc ribbon domain-containing protein [Yinghuangia sp. YIM S10712]|uniref:zinc ribbon domain-containing protein n=1 Tax=Yinghuangia sp. YIM S10712 TaxID=3436930 RepID=UPI003F53833A
MNAAPADQLRLLDLQGLDSRLDRLAHRRRTLPEHEEIDRLGSRLATLRDLVVAAETEDSDAAREQTKAEQDVDQVRSRAERDQQRLDSGHVTSPKELENLQHEITSLAKRQSDLEEVVLEIMERRDEIQTRLAGLVEERDAAQAERDAATARRDAALAEIDTESAGDAKQREVVAAAVPAELLKLYEKIREQQHGVGAAALHQRRCEGCRLELGITDLNAIRSAAPDTVVRCDNCRRILVRTAESGL